MNEYGATNLKIKQEWIQLKGMHPLYHDQVIFSDVDIDIGSAKS
jgi:hypothetical protein